MPLLRRWFEALKPGGVMHISVPDIDRIMRIDQINSVHFKTKGHSSLIGLIYGGQLTPYVNHKTGFNACCLTYLPEQYGFERAGGTRISPISYSAPWMRQWRMLRLASSSRST
jgi:hypothetical protein